MMNWPKKLKNWKGSLEKGFGLALPMGIGKEIEEYFDRQKTEKKFTEEEKDIVKMMVLEVVETI
jgi:hypothetical protein